MGVRPPDQALSRSGVAAPVRGGAVCSVWAERLVLQRSGLLPSRQIIAHRDE